MEKKKCKALGMKVKVSSNLKKLAVSASAASSMIAAFTLTHQK